MRLRAVSAVALSTAAAVALTVLPTGSARPQTTAPTVLVKVNVTITDSKIMMHPRSAPRGANVQFMLRNVGKKTHLFTLGTARRGIGLQTGFKQLVKPGQRRTLILYLDYRGTLPYFGSTPGKSGRRMYGRFLIGEPVAGSFVG